MRVAVYRGTTVLFMDIHMVKYIMIDDHVENNQEYYLNEFQAGAFGAWTNTQWKPLLIHMANVL